MALNDVFESTGIGLCSVAPKSRTIDYGAFYFFTPFPPLKSGLLKAIKNELKKYRFDQLVILTNFGIFCMNEEDATDTEAIIRTVIRKRKPDILRSVSLKEIFIISILEEEGYDSW